MTKTMCFILEFIFLGEKSLPSANLTRIHVLKEEKNYRHKTILGSERKCIERTDAIH